MGIAIPQVVTEDRASGAQVVDGSLKFDGVNHYLKRTPGSAGNRKTWTWSGWVKRNKLGASQPFFSGVQDGNNATIVSFDSSDRIDFYNYTSGYSGRRVTSAVYRDTSSWYHIVLIWNYASTEIKIYVNGTEVTNFGTTGNPSADSIVNSTNPNYIGSDTGFNNQEASIQLSNVYFIDGQALGPGYFGYTDPLTNTWRPKKFDVKKDTLNNGTVWSNTLTKSSEHPSNTPVSLGFDGITGTGNDNFVLTGGGGTIEWTASSYSFPANSTVEVWKSNTGGANYRYWNVDTGSGYGSNITEDGNSGWLSLGTLSNIQKIRCVGTNVDGYGAAWGAIRINGITLVDSNGFGVNGFHLPFDGSAPIGHDLSKLNPVNNGTTWSAGTLAGTIESVRPWQLGFNGDLSTFTRPTNNTMASIVFDTPISFSTKFEIKGTLDSGSLGSYEILDATDTWIDVTSSFGNVTADPLDYPRVDLTSSITSPVKGIRFNGVSAAGQPRFTAVYVDNVVLVDGMYGNGWTPINFGGSMELPKATGALPILNTDGGGKVALPGTRAVSEGFPNATALNDGTVWSSGTISGTQYSASYTWKAAFDGDLINTGAAGGVNGINEYNVSLPKSISFSSGVTVYANSNSADLWLNGTTLNMSSATLHSGSIYKKTFTSVDIGSGILTQVGVDDALTITGIEIDSELLIDGLGLRLALPLVGSSADVSNQINSGSTTKTVTVTNAVASSAQSNFYGGSYYFDGTGDYITIPAQSDFDIKTNDFTVECWVNMTVSASGGIYNTIMMLGQASTEAHWALQVNTNRTFNFLIGTGGWAWNNTDSSYSSNATIADGIWYHIAVVRSGSNTLYFVNGNLDKTITNNTFTDTTSGGYFWLGSYAGYSSAEMTGYLQDVRIYKGVAKYTSNFIPASTNPDVLPDTPSGVSGGSKLTKIIDGAVAFDGTGDRLTLSGDTDFVFNAPSGSTNDFTIEGFFYLNSFSASYYVLGGIWSAETDEEWLIQIQNNGNMRFLTTSGTSFYSAGIGTKKWYHFAAVRSGSTITLYVDGTSVGSYTNSNSLGSNSKTVYWGTQDGGIWDWNGFISNIHVVKGTALYTSNFTPPSAPLTDVTNTTLLCCKSNTSATAFDVSPGTITANGNAAATNFNPFTTDINAVRGQESGYATLNPLDKGSNVTLSDGNLKATVTSPHHLAAGTIMVSSEKYYAEFVYSTLENGTSGLVGVCNPLASRTSYLGGTSGGVGYNPAGNKWVDGSNTAGLPTSAVGDVIGIALNKDANEVSFYKNNVLLFTQTGLNASQPYTFAMGHNNSSGTFNFGQNPFKFPPPEGFLPLNAANARPSTVIARPDQYVGVTTYVGNGTTQTISGLEFSPDFVWIKRRDLAAHHVLFDTIRGFGANKELVSSGTFEEGNTSSIATQEYGYLSAFNSDGFSVAAGTINGTYTNLNSSTYVAWTWKAGGNSNTFNIDDVGYDTASAAGLDGGDITPTGASVNTKSGFSIVKWDGSGSSGTLSHGLGRTPGFILLKGTSAGEDGQNWRTYHSALGTSPSNTLFINLTNASQSNTERISAVGADTFTLSSGGAGVNASGQSYITYIWAEIPGFSKFGSYVGSSSPFVELGFRPAIVIMKNTASGIWNIYDNKRDPINPMRNILKAENSGGDVNTADRVDFLSNGFKVRADSVSEPNVSGTYIYAAWAEAPSFNLYGAQSNAR